MTHGIVASATVKPFKISANGDVRPTARVLQARHAFSTAEKQKGGKQVRHCEEVGPEESEAVVSRAGKRKDGPRTVTGIAPDESMLRDAMVFAVHVDAHRGRQP